MVKICAIGDPHGNLKKVRLAPRKVDAYLLTGDLGKADLARKMFFKNIQRKRDGLPEIERTAEQSHAIHNEVYNSTIKVLKHLGKYAPTYTIQGNVGISSIPEARKKDKKYGGKHPATLDSINKLNEVYLVKNRLRLIGGLRVGFLEYFEDTCWVREFKPSDYRDRMKKAKIETDKARRILKRFGILDILVCHQPPYGILDKVNFPGVPKGWKGKHAGSKVILDYVRKFQPRYVFCGHIHEGEGKKKIGKSQVYNLGVASNVVVDL